LKSAELENSSKEFLQLARKLAQSQNKKWYEL